MSNTKRRIQLTINDILVMVTKADRDRIFVRSHAAPDCSVYISTREMRLGWKGEGQSLTKENIVLTVGALISASTSFRHCQPVNRTMFWHRTNSLHNVCLRVTTNTTSSHDIFNYLIKYTDDATFCLLRGPKQWLNWT